MNISLVQPSISKASSNTVSPEDFLFKMGGFGVLLFAPAYSLLQNGLIDYKSLLLFEGIFFANPHLVSSYLKAYTEKAEIERNKFYTIYTPLLLLAVLCCFVYSFGSSFIWVLGSVYFYWQWWHHARQSFGLGRQFQRRAQIQTLENFDYKLNDIALWSVAVLGICLKSNVAGDYYEGIPIRSLHLPLPLVFAILIGVFLVAAFFISRQIQIFYKHKIVQWAFITHWFTQSFVFICFFGLLPTDIGIIAASFWHCTQYISFVKKHQEEKANRGFIENTFWSNLFNKENWTNYLIILITLSLVLPALNLGIRTMQINAIALGYSLAITFHHYILDAVLWTRKEVEWSLNPNRKSLTT
ncbi:MAG: hypothetical protein SFU25_02325 [Candidatus Caenarcaniphilales bacterium]|nr:hypothetical protein [Candidatus Caenarcaniphilales bacterium]